MRRLEAALALAALLSIEQAPAALAQEEGELDESFCFDGRLTLDPLAVTRFIVDFVAAPGERVVIVGRRHTVGGEFRLFWQALGDSASGTECSPQAPGGGTYATPVAATFDDAGRLLIAGYATFSGSDREGVILRYLYPSCVLDPAFNFDGVFRTNYAENVLFTDLAIDSLQRIVAVGEYQSDNEHILLVRLGASGLYDFAFDGDGHSELEMDFPTSVVAVAV